MILKRKNTEPEQNNNPVSILEIAQEKARESNETRTLEEFLKANQSTLALVLRDLLRA
jgi:hypothetical protein